MTAQGAPLSNSPLTISASQATTILINDLAYGIGPASAATPVAGAMATALSLTTNGQGRLTVTIAATNVTAPTIFVDADLLPSGTTLVIHPDGDSIGLLADSSTTTGSALTSNSIISGTTYDSDQSSAIASAINQLGQTMQSAVEPAGSQDPVAAGYVRTTGRPAIALIPSNAVPTYQRTLQSTNQSLTPWQLDFTANPGPTFGPPDSDMLQALASRDFDSFLHELWGDFVHAVTTGANVVEKVAVEAADEGVKLVVKTADGIKSWVVTEVDQVASLAQAIFTQTKADFDKLFDFLKVLFDWSDIAITHVVLRNAVNSLLTGLANDLTGEIQTNFDTNIGILAAKIDADISSLIPTFTPSGTNPAPSITSTATANNNGISPTANSPYPQTADQNAVQCHYASNKALNYYSNGGTAMTTPSSYSGGYSFGAAAALVNSPPISTGASTPLSSLGDFVNNQASSANGLLDAAVTDLLTALQALVNLVKDGIQDVVDDLLTEASNDLTEIQAWLNNPIDIPILSTIFTTCISEGSTLTILDLACLVAAIPTTLVYKLTVGSDNAPFSDNTATIPSPSYSTLSSSDSIPAFTASLAGPLDDPTLNIFGAVGGILQVFYGLFDVVGDSMAATDAADNPIGTPVSLFLLIDSVLIQGLTFPGTDDDYLNVNWAAGWIPVIADLVAIRIDENGLRFIPAVGPVACSLIGVFQVLVALATAVVQLTDEQYLGAIQTIITPIPEACKFLSIGAAESAGTSLAALLITDAVCDEGAAILQVIASI